MKNEQSYKKYDCFAFCGNDIAEESTNERGECTIKIACMVVLYIQKYDELLLGVNTESGGEICQI